MRQGGCGCGKCSHDAAASPGKRGGSGGRCQAKRLSTVDPPAGHAASAGRTKQPPRRRAVRAGRKSGLDQLERQKRPSGWYEIVRRQPSVTVLVPGRARLLGVQDRQILAPGRDLLATPASARMSLSTHSPARRPVSLATTVPIDARKCGRRNVRTAASSPRRPAASSTWPRPCDAARGRPARRRRGRRARTPGQRRPSMSKPFGLMRLEGCRISGLRHRIVSTPAIPAATTVPVARNTSSSRSASAAVTACVHANRWVPCSSSRASSGAPTTSDEGRLGPPGRARRPSSR